MHMPKTQKLHQVQSFDLTTPDGREEYAELKNREDVKIIREGDFAFGGTGQVVRVVDYDEISVDLDEVYYEPPIN